MMNITGVLVDMLVEIDPILYVVYVVYERGRKLLYVQVLRAICSMLKSSLLWYKKFERGLEGLDFKFSPYEPCVANRTINGHQHTIRFHVDDPILNHMKKLMMSS